MLAGRALVLRAPWHPAGAWVSEAPTLTSGKLVRGFKLVFLMGVGALHGVRNIVVRVLAHGEA